MDLENQETEAKPDYSTTTLGPQTLKFNLPASAGLRYEVWRATATNEVLAHAAALGFCSSKVFHMSGGKVRYDILTYGREVLDLLLAKDLPYLDIIDASRVAFLFLIDGLSLTRSAEVKAAEDFTDPKKDTSTG